MNFTKKQTNHINCSMIEGWSDSASGGVTPEVNMLYKISEVEIKQQVALPTTWAKANALFHKKAVGILSGWTTQNIHTTVLGSKMYEVTLSFHLDGDLDDWKCTCPAATNYDGFCKHTTATLLKMREKQEQEILKKAEERQGWPYNDSTLYEGNDSVDKAKLDGLVSEDPTLRANRILEGFDKALEDHSKRTVKMEFQLEFTSSVFLYGYAAAMSLRIGFDRLYIVKDIKNFLRCIVDEDTEFYTKNFEFDGSLHTFKDEDKDLMNLLLDIYEEEVIRETSRYIGDKSSHIFDKKHVLLSSNRFLRLMRHLPKSNVFIAGTSKVLPAHVVEDSPQFDFYIEDYDDQLCVRMDKEYNYANTDPGYKVLFDGTQTLYITKKTDRKALMQIHDVFSRHTEFFLPKSNINDLANTIFPVLKKVGKIHLSENLSDRMVKRSLEKRLYLDYTKEGVEIRVVFAYGDKTFEPLKKNDELLDFAPKQNQSSEVILRDKVEEKKFLGRFRGKLFEKTKDGFVVSGDHFEYLFLSEYAPKLMGEATIYATDSYRSKRVISDAKIHQSVRLSDAEDYLEYNFAIDGLEDKELQNVLKAYRQKKNYYKLKSGGFISLENDGFEMMDQLMGAFDLKTSALTEPIKLPPSAAYYVDYHMEKSGDAHVSKNDSFKNLISKLHSPESMDIHVPKSLEEILREYQVSGFQWLQTLANCRMGGILADDMGLGKTVQVLTFLLSQKEHGESNPTLIVAPTSLVYNWAAEIEKFTPSLSYQIVHGSKIERTASLKSEDKVDIFITSYATLRRDLDLYEAFIFNSVILDEAQHIKNASSKAAQSAKSLVAKHRFALTGTPMENHLGEFWSIFDFVLPGHLGSKYSFTNTFEKPIVKEQDQERGEALRAMIKPFLLRRLKLDVLPELPEKIESQVVIEMTEEQKKVYAATVARIRGEIEDQIKTQGVAKSQLQILAALTRLRQICSHPSVYLEDYEGSSGKFEAIRELLEELRDGGHRPLIFSQFTSVLGLIKNLVEEMGLKYHYLDGSTPAKDRGKMVDSFNEGSGDLFLISLKAGGSGLNLTGADTVIHFDPWWNPAVEDQASDRAYRIGQTKNVHVMRLVTRGTIEEKIVKLQDKKRELIDRIIKPGETLLSKLDEAEIKAIFDL